MAAARAHIAFKVVEEGIVEVYIDAENIGHLYEMPIAPAYRAPGDRTPGKWYASGSLGDWFHNWEWDSADAAQETVRVLFSPPCGASDTEPRPVTFRNIGAGVEAIFAEVVKGEDREYVGRIERARVDDQPHPSLLQVSISFIDEDGEMSVDAGIFSTWAKARAGAREMLAFFFTDDDPDNAPPPPLPSGAAPLDVESPIPYELTPSDAA